MVKRLVTGSLIITGLLTAAIIAATLIGISYTTGSAASDNRGEITQTAMLWTGGAIVVATVLSIVAFGWLFKTTLGRDSKLLATGVAGTGVVTAVSDTGATINEVNALVELDLTVTIPGRPAYPAKAQVMVNRLSWGSLQVGMAVPVKVDPANPARVVVDWEASSADDASPVMNTPGGPRRVEGTRSADDIVADGEKVEGVILAVSDTGKTVAEMAPGAHRPERADDPVVYASFRVEPPDGPAFVAEGMYRAPRERLRDLSIGARVPVAWLPGDPSSATFDWDRF